MGGMLSMPLHNGFYHCTLRRSSPTVVCSHNPWTSSVVRTHSGMEDPHTVYSPGGNHPMLRESCTAFTFTLHPPYPSIEPSGPRNLSGFPYRRVHSAPASTRARTCWTFVGDQWIANSPCGLWSPSVPCKWVPQPSPYSNFQRISPPSSREVVTARWFSSWTAQASQVTSPGFPFTSFSFWAAGNIG